MMPISVYRMLVTSTCRTSLDGLCSLHEPTVADDIGGKDRDKPPLFMLWAHRSLPTQECLVGSDDACCGAPPSLIWIKSRLVRYFHLHHGANRTMQGGSSESLPNR